MNNVNKTLYIPLCGKAYVSKRGIILKDKKAEEIWEKEGFPLKGRSKSKWLSFYMGMRSAVFDKWLKERIKGTEDPVVIHIGCGMDSRAERVEAGSVPWYDVDFPDVIKERKRYYRENEHYHMIAADVRNPGQLKNIPGNGNALIVAEGVSMYLRPEELTRMLGGIREHFSAVRVLMDCYSAFGAKMSKYKNPINDVGVTDVYGTDDPELIAKNSGLSFVKEHEMTPQPLIDELKGTERFIFGKIYAGNISKKTYRLFEFTS